MDRHLNAFRVKFSDAAAELYEVDPQPTAEGRAKFKQMNAHAMRLSDNVGGYGHYYSLNGTWYAVVIGAKERREVINSENNRKLRYHTNITLSPEQDSDWTVLNRVFFDALGDHLERDGEFWLDDKKNRKRVYTTKPEEIVKGFEVCSGAKLRLDGNDGLRLTVDPTLTVRGEKTLSDFLADNTVSTEEIVTTKDDRYIFEQDDRQTVRLVDILDEPVCECEVDDGESVLEYAHQEYDNRYADRIDPEEPAVLVSYGPGQDYPAPPSLLRYNPVDDFPDDVSQEATFDPDERWRRTQRFREVVEQFDIGTVSIEVASEPVERSPLHYNYPALAFGSEETVKMALGLENRTRGGEITQEFWNPIKQGYLEKFGPRRPIFGAVETAVVFSERCEEEALDFYDKLREYAVESLNLSLSERPAEFALNVPTDMDELRREPERFDAVVGILSSYDEGDYHRLIEDVDGRPVQFLTQEALNNTPEKAMLQNTATGLATKVGVVPFALKGEQLSSQAYLGLNVDGGERGTASAVVVSGVTNEVIYQTEQEEPTGGSSVPGAERAKRIVRDAIRGVLNGENSIDTLRSLTIHRNGFFGNDEEEGIEEGISQLREHGYLPDDFQWVGVEVTHNSPHRLYDDDGMPQMGSQAQFGDDTVVVVTTDTARLEQGSPQTLRCEIAAGTGDFDAYEVGRDVFFLSELNWGSPSNGMKDPITVSLTREINKRLSHEEVSKLRYPPF